MKTNPKSLKEVNRRTTLNFLATLAIAPLSYRANTLAAALPPLTKGPLAEPYRGSYFPNLPLQTQEGKTVRFYDDLLKDKIVTINFFYCRCQGVCSPITSNLLEVQKLLGARVGRDIFMYSISLDPEHDTPAVLKEYAKNRRLGPGWLLLTGRPADIELLRHKLGEVNANPAADRIKSNHSGIVRYGNEARQLWAACPGESRPEWLAKSILWMDRPEHRRKSGTNAESVPAKEAKPI
jgi:protein SCO1